MATHKLTDTVIKNAKPKVSEYILGDGGGLHLKVRPNGRKNWIFRYTRPLVGGVTNMGLGTYPSVSLSDARKAALEARELKSQGIDPQIDRQEKASLSRHTFRQVCQEWFTVKRKQVTADFAEDIWRSLELHVLPRLGNIPISKVTAPLAIETLQAPKNRGNLETVKRIIGRMNEVMTYAVNVGLAPANPLAGIGAAFDKPKVKNQPTIPPEDLPRLMRDLYEANIQLQTRLLIELQLHTMIRPNEVAEASWSEFDLETQIWVIPADRMKRSRDHTIPISPEANQILGQLRSMRNGSNFVFPSSRSKTGHVNTQSANMALKRMGYQDRLTAHGLRSIASTTLHDHGFPSELIEIALSHTSGNQTRDAYDRSQQIER
jgi:integrase